MTRKHCTPIHSTGNPPDRAVQIPVSSIKAKIKWCVRERFNDSLKISDFTRKIYRLHLSARANKIFQKRTVLMFTESWSRDQLIQKAYCVRESYC